MTTTAVPTTQEEAIRADVEDSLLRQRDPRAWQQKRDAANAAANAAAEQIRQDELAEAERLRLEAEDRAEAERTAARAASDREMAKRDNQRVPVVLAVHEAITDLVTPASTELETAKAAFEADADAGIEAIFDHWVAIRTASATVANARLHGQAIIAVAKGEHEPLGASDAYGEWSFADAVDAALTMKLAKPITAVRVAITTAQTTAMERADQEFEDQFMVPAKTRAK